MRIVIKESQPKRLIMEELGIAQEVTQALRDLYPQVVSFAQGTLRMKLDISQIDDNDFKTAVKATYDSFYTKVFGLRTIVWVTKYEFPTQELYNKFSQRYPDVLSFGHSDLLEKDKTADQLISINVASVNNEILTNGINSPLQHELNHLYEQYRMKKKYDIKTGYYRALNLMSNRESDDLQRSIGQIIYYNSEGEIAAFGNSLYGDLLDKLQQNGNVNRKDVYSSPIYERIRQIEDAIQTLRDEGDTPLYRKIIKNSGNNYDFCNLVHIGESVAKEFRKTIGRVWMKFCKDHNLQP